MTARRKNIESTSRDDEEMTHDSLPRRFLYAIGVLATLAALLYTAGAPWDIS